MKTSTTRKPSRNKVSQQPTTSRLSPGDECKVAAIVSATGVHEDIALNALRAAYDDDLVAIARLSASASRQADCDWQVVSSGVDKHVRNNKHKQSNNHSSTSSRDTLSSFPHSKTRRQHKHPVQTSPSTFVRTPGSERRVVQTECRRRIDDDQDMNSQNHPTPPSRPGSLSPTSTRARQQVRVLPIIREGETEGETEGEVSHTSSSSSTSISWHTASTSIKLALAATDPPLSPPPPLPRDVIASSDNADKPKLAGEVPMSPMTPAGLTRERGETDKKDERKCVDHHIALHGRKPEASQTLGMPLTTVSGWGPYLPSPSTLPVPWFVPQDDGSVTKFWLIPASPAELHMLQQTWLRQVM